MLYTVTLNCKNNDCDVHNSMEITFRPLNWVYFNKVAYFFCLVISIHDFLT